MQDIIATPKVTKTILDKYDLKATKRFGQNFLIDANIVKKIAMSACDEKTITVEIGPGIGALTQFLAMYSKRVYAHEIDKKLIDVLADIFKEEDIEIIPGDFLKADLSDMPYSDKEIVVCSNLPYYITTPVLFKLFESDLKIKKIVVMVQKEVADRFVAKVNSPDYSALSVITSFKYDIKLVMNVPKTVFDPRPNVDSAVISFTPKEVDFKGDETLFFELIKASFKQRRKTLKNNLDAYLKDQDVLALLDKADIKPNVRAQELALDDFKRLYEVIYEDQSLR